MSVTGDGVIPPAVDAAASSRLPIRRELLGAALASGTYVAADGLARGLSLLLTLVYTHYVSPESFGTLAITGTVMLLLVPTLGLSVGGSAARLYFEARSDHDRQDLYGSLLLFLLIVPTALVGVIELLGRAGWLDVFGAAPYDPYLRYAVLTAYCGLYLDLVVSIFVAARRPRAVLYLTLLNAAGTLGAGVVLVIILNQGVIGILRAGLASSVVVGIASVALTVRMAGKRLRPSRRWLVPAVAFSVPLIPHAMAQWLLQVSDRPVLSHFVASDQVGSYYLGYSVGAVAGLAVHGATRAMGPVVTRDLKAESVARVETMGTYWFGALVVACVAIALLGRDALTLAVGDRFRAAAPVVPVIALAHIPFAAYAIVIQGVWFAMETRWVPLVSLLAGALNVVLNVLLIPRYGILAAAWDTVAGFAILAFFSGLLAHRLYRIDWEYVRWMKLVAAGLAAFGVAQLAGYDPSAARLALEVVALALVVPAALTIFGFWRPEEVAWLRQQVRGRT